MLTTISLWAGGLFGVLGWYFAYRARGQANDALARISAAESAAASAKQLGIEAGMAAAAADARLQAELIRSSGLESQLAAERAARQDLTDVLQKNGVPVGDLVVDSALDGLYPTGRGANSGANAGRNSAPLPSVLARSSPETKAR